MPSLRHFATAAVAALTVAPLALAAKFAVIATSAGPIVVELDDEKAPITVENFEKYADDGYYDATVFHRVIPGFMIQGGGFDFHGDYPQGLHDKGTHGGLREPIKNEWRNGLKNERGTLAMARLSNKPDSATAQFFINLKTNGFLDQPRDGAGYAVFGKVISGMEVVDQIAGVRTTRVGGMADVPLKPVMIETVKMLSKSEAMNFAKKARIEAATARVAELEAELETARRELEAARKDAGETKE